MVELCLGGAAAYDRINLLDADQDSFEDGTAHDVEDDNIQVMLSKLLGFQKALLNNAESGLDRRVQIQDA